MNDAVQVSYIMVKMVKLSYWYHEGVMGYSTTHFRLQHYVEVSGQLCYPAALPTEKNSITH